MSDDVTFTGERLHAGDRLFSVDLARHEAAYQIARARLPARSSEGGPSPRVLDLGCGSGYGAAALATVHTPLIGLDRIRPDAANRGATAFVRADLHGIPLRAASFELIVSFQVIEHLEDPAPYLAAISQLLAPGGTALITTPNIEMSDGVNPYHVHEYRADELTQTLTPYFSEVAMHGIGATEAVHAYFAARSARIRRIMRIDPLGLRNALPRPLLEWLFARFAVLVRRNTARDDGAPDATWKDFPVGPADSRCLDLLAVCTKR